jgi:superfamily II DNA/RNA helicase
MDPAIIDILSNKGITQFTPVQAQAFDPVLAGRHVIGRSRTGTGYVTRILYVIYATIVTRKNAVISVH